MRDLSPSYDNKIAQKYSVKTLEQKVKNKEALQEKLKWVAEPKRPVICIPVEMSDEMGGELLQQLVPALMELNVELLIRGKGSKKYGELFTNLQKDSNHRVAILHDEEDDMRMMFAGSDIALFPALPKEEEVMENALRYGVIPVCQKHKLLEDYNPVQEAGNAFVFQNATVWQSFAAVVRALETLKFPFDWRTIQRHAMETINEK